MRSLLVAALLGCAWAQDLVEQREEDTSDTGASAAPGCPSEP